MALNKLKLKFCYQLWTLSIWFYSIFHHNILIFVVTSFITYNLITTTSKCKYMTLDLLEAILEKKYKKNWFLIYTIFQYLLLTWRRSLLCIQNFNPLLYISREDDTINTWSTLWKANHISNNVLAYIFYPRDERS